MIKGLGSVAKDSFCGQFNTLNRMSIGRFEGMLKSAGFQVKAMNLSLPLPWAIPPFPVLVRPLMKVHLLREFFAGSCIVLCQKVVDK